MRVVVNAISARAGGIVTYTRNLMISLKERGIDALFVLSHEFPEVEGIEALRLSANRLPPMRRVIWEQTVWRRIVRREKPDILFSSANFGLISPPVSQVLLVREGGLFDPFYLTTVAPSLGTRAVFQRMARRRLILASAHASQTVLTPTAAMKDLLIAWDQRLAEKVEVNLYGTKPNLFASSGTRRRWRQDGILKILYVSAYYPHKQPGLVAEAVRMLNESGIPTHLTLTMSPEQISLFGGGHKDDHLLKWASKRGEVTMTGNIPYENLSSFYDDHDVFVFPSLSETFGHPLAEAMSMGIPVIASDTPVHREVCNGAAAFFSPLSATDLVERLRDLDQDPESREARTALGRTRIEQDLTWEAHVDRLVEAFERIESGR